MERKRQIRTFCQSLKIGTMSNLNLHGGNGKRRALDFYPTPADVTRALLLFLEDERILKTQRGVMIWDPACGDGAMLEVFSQLGYGFVGSDINVGVDYLSVPVYPLVNAIITNPPFNLSEQFIRKAVTEAPLVCMLLKSQYWHAAKRKLLFDEYPPSYVLPLTWRPDFDGRGAPTMEVYWSVWWRQAHGVRTIYQPLNRPR